MFIFFFNDTATTEIYTLSLHDALPILGWFCFVYRGRAARIAHGVLFVAMGVGLEFLQGALGYRVSDVFDMYANALGRSEEHTSELQSRQYLVCRLLLEKKKILSQLILF